MKLYILFETQDYGSRFINQRDLVFKLKKTLVRLKQELKETEISPDLRDQESDRDRTGGNIYLKRAISKIEKQLEIAQNKLEKLGELWAPTTYSD